MTKKNLHSVHLIYTISVSMGVVNLIPHSILFLIGCWKRKLGCDWPWCTCSAPSNTQGLGQQTCLSFDVAASACRGGSIHLLSLKFQTFALKNPKICKNYGFIAKFLTLAHTNLLCILKNMVGKCE